MLGIVFAQFVAVAHACTLVVPVFHAATFVQPADNTMPSDCPSNGAPANVKVCDSHCAYGQQIDAQPDALDGVCPPVDPPRGREALYQSRRRSARVVRGSGDRAHGGGRGGAR